MKDTELTITDIRPDTGKATETPIYREWRTTKHGVRYLVSSHRPLNECANAVMQGTLDFSLKQV